MSVYEICILPLADKKLSSFALTIQEGESDKGDGRNGVTITAKPAEETKG